MSGWQEDVLDFWFGHLGERRWFAPTPEIDEDIRDRYQPLWDSLRGEAAIFFVADARPALAATILFDQFPRNMFRHEPAAFATDPLALQIATLALDAGHDRDLAVHERQFLYMPFMHAENPEAQDRSVELFDALGLTGPLEHAILHRDVIRRFGRFPHRNEVLGRETREGEREEIATGAQW